jgi:hypothetical protein
MDDAGLQRRLRVDRGEGLAHPFQPIGHRDADVLAAARFEIGEIPS